MSNNGNNIGRRNVLQLQCEPIECVRIGFVGLGVRAKRAVHRMMHIEGCRITALCDLVEENIEEAKGIITEQGGDAPTTYCDSDGWKCLCVNRILTLCIYAPTGQAMPTLPYTPCSAESTLLQKCRQRQPLPTAGDSLIQPRKHSATA